MENFIISPNFNLHPVTNFKIEEVDKLSGITYNAAGDITAINIAELQQQAGRMVKYDGDIWYCTDLNNDDDYTWYAVTLRRGTDGIYCFKKLDKDNKKIIDVAIIGNLSISQITGLQSALDGKVDKVTGKGLSTNDYTEEERLKVATIDNKVDKETGKGLSTNDYTTAEKTKLAGIEAGAQKNVHSDWNQTDTTKDDYIENKPTIPTKTSQLTNDSNFATTSSSAVTVEHPSDLVYTIKQNGATIGAINIPKDLVVSNKSYLSTDGKTLHLILNDESQTDISIDVSKLIDVYGGSTGTTIDVTVDSSHNIKAEIKNDSITASHIKDGIITIAKLSNDLQNKINSIATHNHDGDNSERVDYNDLLNLPSISEAVTYVSEKLTGGSGNIAMTTHLCGYAPTVYCVKGTKVIEIYFEINYNTGNVHWEADPEFTTDDNARIVMIGALQQSSNSKIFDDQWYGIRYQIGVNKSEERIGSMDLHRSLPLQNQMRRCLLDDNGNVIKYLSSTDSTKDISGNDVDLSGANGQVMVELPDMYYNFYTEDGYYYCKLSPYKITGFKKWKKKYVSAYEASVSRTTLTLASVVNDTAEYRGGNNTASWDETYRSLLGRPATYLSAVEFMNYARKRGAGWYSNLYEAHVQIFWLFAVEFCTFNSQAVLGGASRSYVQQENGSKYAKPNTQGLMDGGLGDGVSTLTSAQWESFNSYNPFVPCGMTNVLGNRTGTVQYTITNASGDTIKTVEVPSYRGIENPFGHIWKWTEGAKVVTVSGAGKLYVAEDLTSQSLADNNTNVSGYRFVGDLPATNGYVKNILGGEYGDILPKEIGGSASSFFYDYFYQSTSPCRVCAVGGDSSSGTFCGLGDVDTYNVPSRRHVHYGSRLCFQA